MSLSPSVMFIVTTNEPFHQDHIQTSRSVRHEGLVLIRVSQSLRTGQELIKRQLHHGCSSVKKAGLTRI